MPMSVRYVLGLESAASTLDWRKPAGYFTRQSNPDNSANFNLTGLIFGKSVDQMPEA
jgi:hypothetical protein